MNTADSDKADGTVILVSFQMAALVSALLVMAACVVFVFLMNGH